MPEAESQAVAATRYVGRPVPRLQDPRLLSGRGHYVDDVDDAGALHAAFIRATIAHGRLSRFDAGAVTADGSAALVLGPDEIEKLAQPLPTVWRLPGQQITDIPLATRTVRYVGQPVGLVVARSRAAAEDAAERVVVEYEPLPVVTDLDAALDPAAQLLYPEHGTNAAGQIHFGAPVQALDEALAAAAHVVDLSFGIQRVAHSPMEPRGVLAEWVAATEQLTAWMSSQAPQAAKHQLAASLGLRDDQVRVVAPDVGGSFGGKAVLTPDEVLVCLAARELGGRVKWIEDRAENLAGAYQGRGQRARARLGLDEGGRFLALRVEILGDLGAYPSQAGSGPFQVAALAVEGPYRFELAGATVTGVHTNTVPTGAYRGYGMQEAAWIRERLIDEAARMVGSSALDLRLRNMIEPGQLPHTTHTYLTYDSGDYPTALRRAARLGEERRRDRDRGDDPYVRRGVGLACSVEITGFAPSALLEQFGIGWSGWESGRIRVNVDGSVTVYSGVVGVGQGIETALAQLVADELRIPIEWIRVELGDTATSSHSDLTSQASRALTLAGTAVATAGARLRERMLALAAGRLDVSVDRVSWDGAYFRAGPAPGEAVAWQEVAHRGWMGWGRGDGDRIQLEETVDYDPPAITYSYSAHGAAVAVDLETGRVTVEDYWSVNDSGVLVNPMIADGQIVGAIAQGIGLALLEEIRYDRSTGGLLTPDLTGYRLPIAADVPEILVEHTCTPSTVIPGGYKGLGEGGMIPSPAAVGNAVAAAVPEIAGRIVETPLTAPRVWAALNEAGLAR